jgi:hypothetical protein
MVLHHADWPRSRCSADLSDRESCSGLVCASIPSRCSAPTVGRRGFRGAVNDLIGWIFAMDRVSDAWDWPSGRIVLCVRKTHISRIILIP